MSVFNNFDKIFLHLPPFDRKDDFNKFWDKAVNDLKSVPMQGQSVLDKNKSSSRFKVYSINFKSAFKVQIHGTLYIPVETKNPNPVIIVHDYNRIEPYKGFGLDENLAFLFLRLRGHQDFHAVKKEVTDKKNSQQATPGFMIENILDKNNYYVKGVYLDVLRSIDFLRLTKGLNCTSVGIIGKGLGAAAALFTSIYSKRVSAIVMDSPGFSYLPVSQNKSGSDITKEINQFLEASKTKRGTVKDNLTYFDSLNFADAVKCPVTMAIGLKDANTPGECAFSLFDHLVCDKTADIYPDSGNEAGAEKQFHKSLKWLKKILMIS
jgi:cephalosporin-C deacetylase